MDQNSPPSSGSNPPSRLSPPDNLPSGSMPGSDKPQNIDLRFSEPNPNPVSGAPEVPRPPTIMPSETPRPTASAPAEYKSSIRSMADDIARLKVGQRPSGTEIQNKIGPQPILQPRTDAPVPPAPPVPRLTVPGPQPQARLGETEKSRPLAPTIPSPRPSLPQSDRPVQALVIDNERPSGSRGFLYIIILAIVLLGGGLYWFLANRDSEVAQSPTPSLVTTTTPAPTPIKSIGELIGGSSDTIIIADIGDPITDFLNKVNVLAIGPGETRKILITGETKGSGDFGLVDLMDRFLLTYPTSLKSALGTDVIMLVYGQREAFTAQGQLNLSAPVQKRLVFLTEAKEPALLSQILSSWESTMANSLGSLLNLNKALGREWLTNNYNNNGVRYQNFPYPDKAIDYAVINTTNGKLYLLVAGSRESALNTLDKLR